MKSSMNSYKYRELLKWYRKPANFPIKKLFNDQISRIKDLEESEEAIKYYNKEIVNTSIKEIKSSINSLIEVQLQRKMLTNVRTDYLLQYIDSPFLPIFKSEPRRSSYAITGMLLGLFLSAFFFIVTYKED